eukprot:TRINITY_DN1440_c0_g1_i1.p1 TRINITY_DN1440_c0_g1~~TRINITY_DN1440_c0_g1_i1.p1  ORF type:complete len:261 (+),score=54.56 TRINITY_DN1440_c0_g1_i1:224-1006(+)
MIVNSLVVSTMKFLFIFRTLNQFGKRNVTLVQLDVLSDESALQFAHAVQGALREQRACRGLVLVNNAGVHEDGWRQEVFDHMLGVNAWGAVRVTEAVLPIALAEGTGQRHVVAFVSSGLGKLRHLSRHYRELISGRLAKEQPPSATAADAVADAGRSWRDMMRNVVFDPNDADMMTGGPASYKLSKACLNAYARMLDAQLRSCHAPVAVRCCDPGWTRTDMGGPHANRSPEEAAASIEAALLDPSTGELEFSHYGQAQEW